MFGVTNFSVNLKSQPPELYTEIWKEGQGIKDAKETISSSAFFDRVGRPSLSLGYKWYTAYVVYLANNKFGKLGHNAHWQAF